MLVYDVTKVLLVAGLLYAGLLKAYPVFSRVNNILDISPLYEKIDVDKSSWKMSEKRITITLKKLVDTKWYKLMKGGVIGMDEPAYATAADGTVLRM